jgi:membrane protein YdbS with pleckstrin-like domain
MTSEPADGPTPGLDLREPAHRVSPRAVSMWRAAALLAALPLGVGALVAWLLVPTRPWWATAGLVVLALADAAYVAVMPSVRFRVHRWEVTPTAVHTRSGWLSRETRIAPLSRVQTVDSRQGPVMRFFRLAALTVTTASAAGPITIAGLDQDEARRVVAELTEITGQSQGDAT